MARGDDRRVLSFDENLARLPSAVGAGANVRPGGWLTGRESIVGRSFCFVGSGASVSVAHFGARLFESMLCAPSRVKSPFDFRNSPLLHEGVVLVSASGNNRDILAALERAISAGHKPIIAVTCNPDSELLARGRELEDFGYLDIPFRLHGEREGFLGVQSLAASASGLLSYCWSLLSSVSSPDLKAITDLVRDRAECWEQDLKTVSTLSHLVALGSGWSMPALVDLESKFVEGGLGWLEVTETKNFTHGRFVNSYTRAAETALLVLGTAEDEVLRKDFQREYGRSLKVIDLSVPNGGPLAGLTLLLAVQFVYHSLAKARGLGGKPPVPPEARRMFRGDHIYPELECRADSDSYAETVAGLKAVSVGKAREGRERAFRSHPVVASCLARLASAHFHGLACDYDGTIVSLQPKEDVPGLEIAGELRKLLEASIPIAIVTGRGRSAIDHLREVIPEAIRRHVHCFLYNGGVYWRLDKAEPEVVAVLNDPEGIASRLRGRDRISALSANVEIASLRSQVTVHVAEAENAQLLRIEVEAALEGSDDEFTVLTSGRSVDVFPRGVSKRRACESFRLMIAGGDILVIGDQGCEGGNDVELLALPNSLSVGTISLDSRSCFPVLSESGEPLLGPVGLTRLLQNAKIESGTFTVKLFGLTTTR